MGIGIIGHFGGNEKFNDGQTVKTVAIYDALIRYGIKDIDKIDTYYIKRNPFVFIKMFISGVINDKKYIVLLSSKGRKILFPVLELMSKYLKKDIYHYAIGGRLAREVNEKSRWKKYVSSFKGNWMESIELVNQLQKLGVRNAIYLPNFKRLNLMTETELRQEYDEPYKLCTFSRVIKEKGIEDAIESVRAVNAEFQKKIVTLDIYGAAEEKYITHLKKILKKDNACRYCGVIPANESVETLKDYYVLLFPTYWSGEGMPGTIIDALSAGVPVIARRWQYCDEMLTDGYTGLIYDFEKPEQLKEKIVYAVNHVADIVKMKKNCLKKAESYSEENVIKQIIKEMELM